MVKIRPDDDGPLAVRYSVTPDKKTLLIDYSKPISWLGLHKKDVVNFANLLLKHSKDMIDSDEDDN